jgi:TetR/AcrR family transcriptional repressor of lmrAB and yxaGH operons
MAHNTRDRMIEAAIEGLERHGVAGMSFTAVLDASGAARGAIYHHFPGGKPQLVAEAADRYGRRIRDRLADLPDESPRSVVEAFFTAVRPLMRAAALGDGCAVAAVTVDAGLGHEQQQRLFTIASAAYGSWAGQLAERLTSAGLADARARDLATTLVALLEGAEVLCRATGNLEPFDRAVRTAEDFDL